MKFQEVIGRQEVKDKLIHGVSEGRISHAQLFSCYEGSYGLPMAFAYAAYIQCENPETHDSCGVCSSCLKHQKLIHPDLHFSYPVITLPGIKDRSTRSTDFIKHWRKAFLENPYMNLNDWYLALGVENKQGFMSVEESADILRKMSLKSFESKFKIQIIWMPEKMRVDATNKLLKIIEEPPPNTLFILVTDQRDQLLPTILSRTQLVKIPMLQIDEIAIAITKKYNTEPRNARRIAKLANGNLNMAFSLAGSSEKDLSLETDFITWMRLCYSPFHEKDGKSSWTDLNTWIERTSKGGRESLKQFFTFCLEASRECMLVNHGDSEMVRFDDEVIPNFSRFTRFIHSGNVAEITDLLNKAYYAIERNANAKILLLDLSFKMNRLLNKGLAK
jgi:DNA polymerase III subunit delta'